MHLGKVKANIFCLTVYFPVSHVAGALYRAPTNPGLCLLLSCHVLSRPAPPSHFKCFLDAENFQHGTTCYTCVI